MPVSLEDLKRFNASVQIAWWETAGSVPADKSWVNVSTYGAPTVSGATSVEWWSPATEFNYQIAYWMAGRRFVQKDADGTEVTHTFTTLAAPAEPPKPSLTVKHGDTKILLCWNGVTANPPVSRYQYRFDPITAGTPAHTDQGMWQDLNNGDTSKDITGLANDSMYIVQFNAVNDEGKSDTVWQTVTPVAGAAAPTCGS